MIPTRLQRVATGRTVLVSLVVWIGYAILFFTLGPYSSLQSAAGGELLEETFGYGPTEAQEWLQGIGEEGRTSYRTLQLLDGLNALFMTVALTLALAFTLSRLLGTTNPLRLAVYFPVLAGALELIENSLLLTMGARFPAHATAVGALAGLERGPRQRHRFWGW